MLSLTRNPILRIILLFNWNTSLHCYSANLIIASRFFEFTYFYYSSILFSRAARVDVPRVTIVFHSVGEHTEFFRRENVSNGVQWRERKCIRFIRQEIEPSNKFCGNERNIPETSAHQRMLPRLFASRIKYARICPNLRCILF